MKLMMDEKMKHRLVGLAVIISLAIIFAPAMMRKSNQPIQKTMSLRIAVPNKPAAPDVVLKDEETLFKTIKIAKKPVQLDASEKQLPNFVKAEPLKDKSTSQDSINKKLASEIAPVALPTSTKPVLASAENKSLSPTTAPILNKKMPVKQATIAVAKSLPPKASVHPKIARALPVAGPARVALTSPTKGDMYALQLASFTQFANAQALISKLRSKGYKATYTTTGAGSKTIYKVVVGHSQNRNEVLQLKSQLASALQLNGFVVNTRVS